MSTPPPIAAPDPVDFVAEPRGDENSRLAHEQLVAKARSAAADGGRYRIDLYFLGDSITRRWGCTDPAWAELLAHWVRHYAGRNAGNFGWGGDRVANVLWRVRHGELDGVHPKVIVILAGTNDVGTRPGDAAKADRIVAGHRALLAACREKAPDATVVLTAIFPRNDDAADPLATMPEIGRINAELARLADGEQVRFLDVNAGLTDERGRLFDGMAIDGLHLSVTGYEVWAAGLRPLLAELLGPPAAVDRAPPPTGDPSLAGGAT